MQRPQAPKFGTYYELHKRVAQGDTDAVQELSRIQENFARQAREYRSSNRFSNEERRKLQQVRDTREERKSFEYGKNRYPTQDELHTALMQLSSLKHTLRKALSAEGLEQSRKLRGEMAAQDELAKYERKMRAMQEELRGKN
jgi:hypothetical protein